ncbi:HTH-type transcriptional activator RhaS [Dyadobacter sp. CECT 9623]|uniref:HTH-type transcriptional activator RhaS n=1 Tax=Dyadobacter linearis TaxID=2823330 RepID=A0ABM8UJY6_9BACT|nr:AraC family transcriptional regulator [Dyadobacter sp. CECT 9623]CAG5067792.1 HTH-type transcriptional activator RhaS [Dyadobacter sp. CECT 9623]
MKKITILVPDGENNLSSIVGAYKILKRANKYWEENHKKTLYQIELAGLSEQVDFHDGLFSVRPHVHISAVSKTNLIIIPSLNHEFEQAVEKNQPLIQWIRDQYRGGAEVASICTGAFLLASSGLINGKTCSTHWAFADLFKTKFPEINVQKDRLITDENGIYTNGGAYSFLNLILYLVEKYFDRQTAIFCSKVFQIDIEREAQSPFIIFAGQKSHEDEIIRQAQVYIEKHVESKISIAELASRFAVGRRNFDRRFIRATGNTPIEYAQRVKMEAAKKSFETNSKNIKEVMYETGYSDMKAFREVFKKVTGVSPLEYRLKYNKDALN